MKAKEQHCLACVFDLLKNYVKHDSLASCAGEHKQQGPRGLQTWQAKEAKTWSAVSEAVAARQGEARVQFPSEPQKL
jgi:hypothetical protein